jgi:hypothetical protein
MKFGFTGFFENLFKKIQVLFKSDKNNVRVLYMKTNTHFRSYLAQFFLE